MTKKILSIIPARAGSKGLPGKNIIDLAGKPLIAWSIEASLNLKYITKTLVSSDGDNILDVAQAYGADVLKRPSEFASDSASSESVLQHALKETDEDYEYIILLQPTSPLRDSKDIDKAFEKLFSTDATALISVYETDNKILKAFKEDSNGYIEGISNNQYPFMPRQNLPKTYISNGAIYIIKVDEFLKNNSFYTDKTISFIMDEIKSIDIDTKEDLEKSKELYKMKKLKTLHLASFNGNIGDNANHNGFYKHLHNLNGFEFDIDELEIREFYWKQRFFDESFVELVNSYDLLVVGGGNYFELWVEDSPTGTSISIELELLKKIRTPILFNALGVDPGQGASEQNIQKFREFLDCLIERDDFISIRNDGAKKAIVEYVGEEYLEHIHHTVDAGFFAEIPEPSRYYQDKKYIAINVAYDMQDVRFEKLPYDEFLQTFKSFIDKFLDAESEYEIVLVPHIFRDMTFITDLLEILDDETRRRRVSVAPLLHGRDAFKEVMSIYKGAEVVLANRFHANVCPIGMGVPTIGLVNYRQVRELYNELESESFVDVSKYGFDDKLLEKVELKNQNIDVDFKTIYTDFMKKVGVWIRSRD